ncbi:hypothetical protein [Sinorhizobium meliloti]
MTKQQKRRKGTKVTKDPKVWLKAAREGVPIALSINLPPKKPKGN